MSWAAIKAQARKSVHSTFTLNGEYTAPGGQPIPVNVRVHRTDETYGNYDGIGYAETTTAPFVVVFLLEEVALPERGAVLVLETGETFEIDSAGEPDYPTIACPAVRTSA